MVDSSHLRSAEILGAYRALRRSLSWQALALGGVLGPLSCLLLPTEAVEPTARMARHFLLTTMVLWVLMIAVPLLLAFGGTPVNRKTWPYLKRIFFPTPSLSGGSGGIFAVPVAIYALLSVGPVIGGIFERIAPHVSLFLYLSLLCGIAARLLSPMFFERSRQGRPVTRPVLSIAGGIGITALVAGAAAAPKFTPPPSVELRLCALADGSRDCPRQDVFRLDEKICLAAELSGLTAGKPFRLRFQLFDVERSWFRRQRVEVTPAATTLHERQCLSVSPEAQPRVCIAQLVVGDASGRPLASARQIFRLRR